MCLTYTQDTRQTDWSWLDHNLRKQFKRSHRFKELQRRINEGKRSFMSLLHNDEDPGGGEEDEDQYPEEYDEYEYTNHKKNRKHHHHRELTEEEVRRKVDEFLGFQVLDFSFYILHARRATMNHTPLLSFHFRSLSLLLAGLIIISRCLSGLDPTENNLKPNNPVAGPLACIPLLFML